ncbi:MAG: secretin and TonB N-terminal domain-containing protein [Novosphingobium sp.]
MVGFKVKRGMWAAVLMSTVALGTALPQAAYAQNGGAQQKSFSVAAQSLDDALALFGQQAGLQISAHGDLVRGLRSPGVSGTYSTAEALSRLLTGTGLTWRFSGNAVVLARAPQTADGSIQLGPVRVEGSDNAMAGNGTDGAALALTMTEGTKSLAGQYAQVGGKSAQRLRDIPRSVTVLTSQEIEDKNITTLTNALDQVTGIYVASYNTRTPVFYSRGFLLQNLTIDGGSPMRMHDGLQSIINGVGLPNLLGFVDKA